MRLQDFIADSTMSAFGALFRNAHTIPEDKINWQPASEARSVLDQLQECAQAPSIFIKMLEGEKVEFSPQFLVEARRQRREWTTVGECERVCEFMTKKLCDAIRTVPEERMTENVTLPWGEEISMRDMLNKHYWNMVWHTGQIAYIQRLLGDKDMH
jgi:uncharacterized damage-inducible protein DinB